ncbi:MAG: YitT family protein [Lactobacillaceae bacterium]|jgi:uncharacterized membrane-anchored protein YitT (DUF2179 family)|nr:YitT family protein [Lactobacillaceae bacterium]
MENTTKSHLNIRVIDLLATLIGTGMYGFGLANINIPNNLAEGGVSGLTLIARALFHINPAYTTLLFNLPLILIGMKLLTKRDVIYTVWGIVSLSFWIWLWQLMPFLQPDLKHDMFVAALLAGAIGGLGSGLVYRFGGTTGGADIVARIFEQRFHVPMGRTLFIVDAGVLTLSLIYINIPQMVYTLMAAFVFAQLVNFTQQGSYAARAFMIFSTHNEEISHAIMKEINRGTTLLHSEGGYSHEKSNVLYTVVDPSEIHKVRQLVHEIDQKAFVTIVNTSETVGEGFTYLIPKKKSLLSLRK